MFPMNCCTRVFEFYINGSYNLHIVVCEGALKIRPQDLNTAILEKIPAIISWNGMDKAGLRKGILMCRAKRLDERYASVKDIIREREGL